jgi:hypothetical protein
LRASSPSDIETVRGRSLLIAEYDKIIDEPR